MSKKDKNTEMEMEEEVTTQETSKKEEKKTSEDQKKDQAQELETLRTDLDKEKDRYLRLFAEFENYKKRTSRERVELFKTAGQEVISSLLPVMDDFDRAIKEFSSDADDIHVQGMVLIKNKFSETLKSKGLEEMETKQGDTFDAEIHEAITQIPAPSDDLKGKVIDVIEKGYRLGEKIIRFPKVVIGQ
ncbi:MAG: nucleotide exchange factor GrpE [Flavobacteriaceae bacterium]|nr:nucleotide exchange factor GrpE [Flavobacteriaceae bacterium]